MMNKKNNLAILALGIIILTSGLINLDLMITKSHYNLANDENWTFNLLFTSFQMEWWTAQFMAISSIILGTILIMFTLMRMRATRND